MSFGGWSTVKSQKERKQQWRKIVYELGAFVAKLALPSKLAKYWRALLAAVATNN
jgi:hypothetical protein